MIKLTVFTISVSALVFSAIYSQRAETTLLSDFPQQFAGKEQWAAHVEYIFDRAPRFQFSFTQFVRTFCSASRRPGCQFGIDALAHEQCT